MNFNNLSTDGFVAFVLAIIFTIATLASFIYYARHKELNRVVTIVITMVLPTVTVFCWMYLIFKVRNFTLANTCIWAAVSAALYLIVALAIAYIIVTYTKANAEKSADEEKTEETSEEKQEDLLLINAPAEEEKQEDVVLIETAEEQPVEEEKTEETEETAEEQPVEESEESENGPEGVIFTKASKESFAIQLARLPIEQRKLYKEILEYAEAKEDTKTKESTSHVMVKVGRMRLIEFKFSRGNLVCKFMAGSSELKNYSLAEKAVKIKEKPVTIDLENEESVAVAKNMVDIVYKNIIEAKEDKKASDVIAPVMDEAPETTEENGENE